MIGKINKQYTLFSKEVNLCSRLEQLNKVYGTKVLVLHQFLPNGTRHACFVDHITEIDGFGKGDYYLFTLYNDGDYEFDMVNAMFDCYSILVGECRDKVGEIQARLQCITYPDVTFFEKFKQKYSK